MYFIRQEIFWTRKSFNWAVTPTKSSIVKTQIGPPQAHQMKRNVTYAALTSKKERKKPKNRSLLENAFSIAESSCCLLQVQYTESTTTWSSMIGISYNNRLHSYYVCDSGIHYLKGRKNTKLTHTHTRTTHSLTFCSRRYIIFKDKTTLQIL